MPYVAVFAIFAGMAVYMVFYILSVHPAQLEQKIGPAAYPRCARLRMVAFVGMGASFLGEVLYVFYPLDTGLPPRLIEGAAGWAISIAIGAALTVFATWIIWKVGKVAPDSFVPRKENQMFGGIYTRVRHPQAVADVTYWFAIGFLLNSPFLLVVALIWVPLNYLLTVFEEQDLKVRFGQDYVDYIARTGRFVPRS